MIGRILAHYKILEKIGSGGMGEVYLAEDTKLDRKVALKVLPPELAESEERRARFKREAKAVAALNHPNIVTVYSVEEDDSVHFITMELVKGKTVTELLPKNGFPLSKFFDVAIPLANAVAAAHQEGITHRDLKPDNMMVGDDGRVKVLDFGLAKPTSGFAGGDAASALPTVAKTAEGVIVGTVNYMSPEQAQGKAVDARSDIFSFGVVLYEMLTGQRPFGGETPAEILSSIIKDTPESTSDLNPAIPRDLAKLVKRCLAKDPIRRYQSAVDLRNDLEESKQDVDSGDAVTTAAPGNVASGRWRAAALMVGLAVVVGILYSILSPKASPSVPRLANPVQLTSAVGVEDYPTWSADGGRLAYQSQQRGNDDIWVAQPGGGQPVNRTADHTGRDCCPSWSPDGSQIAFWSDRDGGGYFVMSALGGAARKVISSGRFSNPPQWSADGEELAGVVTDGFVEIVSMRTRESRRVALPDERSGAMGLSWSSDGRFFAFVDGADSHDVTRLWTVRADDGQVSAVTDGRTKVWSPSWTPDGSRLYFVSNRGGNMDLWLQRMGPDADPEDSPQPVTVGIGMRYAVFSPDGTKLAYSRGREVANLWRVPILEDRPATWADAQQLTFDEAFIEFVDVSPDGERLLVRSDRSGNADLWMLTRDSGELMQVTSDPALDSCPRWSPDGQDIAFHSYRTGNREIWVMPVSGGPARQLTDGKATNTESWMPTWSPDGREIAFSSSGSEDVSIYVMPSDGGKARQVTRRPEEDWQPNWSPDGEWLVLTAEDRLWRVPAAGGNPEPLTEGQWVARWSRDGKRVYFAGRPGTTSRNLWAVSPEDGTVQAMTDLAGRQGRVSETCVATDGQFLFFAWREDSGDIWVMDVVTDESE